MKGLMDSWADRDYQADMHMDRWTNRQGQMNRQTGADEKTDKTDDQTNKN